MSLKMSCGEAVILSAMCSNQGSSPALPVKGNVISAFLEVCPFALFSSNHLKFLLENFKILPLSICVLLIWDQGIFVKDRFLYP